MMLSKRLWAVLLLAVLVAGVLVGFGDGDEAIAKEPRATIGKIMIPAAAFVPTDNGWDYDNTGLWLGAHSGSGLTFVAPVWFPVPVVNIRKITLIGYDSRPGNVCAWLTRSHPLQGPSGTDLGPMLCTADRTADPQLVSVGASGISPRKVNATNQGLYLNVMLDTGPRLYGVQVIYSY